MNVTAKYHQTLLDIAVQYYGDATEVFNIATMNNLSVSDSLYSGMNLIIDPPAGNGIAKYFSDKSIEPTCADEGSFDVSPEGIGNMAVGIDFVVS